MQLRKLPGWVTTRRDYAEMLNVMLVGLRGLRLAIPPAHVGHAYYRYYAFVKPEELHPGWTRDRIVAEVSARGVPCLTGSCSEIYLEKAFGEAWLPAKRLPVARELGETSIALLVHPTLAAEQIEGAARTVRDVMIEAGG